MDNKVGNGNPLNTEPELSEQEEKALTSAEALAAADAAEVAEKNRRLFARLRKEQEARKKADEENIKKDADLKAAQGELATFKQPKGTGDGSPQPSNLSVEDFIEFKTKGLSDVEVKEVVSKAKDMGIPVSKFIGSDLFSPWLEVKRSKEKSEANTPSPSFSSVTSKSGKKWEDLGLSDDERAQMFEGMKGEVHRRNTSV